VVSEAKQKAATRRSVTADCEMRLFLWVPQLLLIAADYLRRRLGQFDFRGYLVDLRVLRGATS
jgi:hypothetical protein